MRTREEIELEIDEIEAEIESLEDDIYDLQMRKDSLYDELGDLDEGEEWFY